MKGYPDWFARFVIVTMTVLFVSGGLLVPTALDMRLEIDVPWRLSGADRIAVVATHVLLSFIMLLIAGALWQLHMQAGLRKGRNVFSGVTVASILAFLTLTGVGILYFGNEEMSVVASLSHLLGGAIVALLFLLHVVKGRRQLRADSASQ